MPTIEQNIVNAVISRLRGIIAGNTVTAFGRQHTYSLTVKDALDGELLDIAPAKMPCINVLTASGESASAGAWHHDHRLQLVLVLYLAENIPGPVLRDFIADVFACIGTDETWGIADVISTDDPTYTKEFLPAGQFVGSAQIGVAVTYRSRRWQL